jgi:hypothetical protein
VATKQQLALARPNTRYDKGAVRLKDGTLLTPRRVVRLERVDAPDRNLLAAVKFRGLIS